jgi:hypothetical protein
MTSYVWLGIVFLDPHGCAFSIWLILSWLIQLSLVDATAPSIGLEL